MAISTTVYPFTFTIDSSGSPDDIQLPDPLPSGLRSIELKPPTGHAWTFYGESAVGWPRDIDETVELNRKQFEPAYLPGEIIGRGALDSGTGTGNGLIST